MEAFTIVKNHLLAIRGEMSHFVPFSRSVKMTGNDKLQYS